MPKNAKLDYQVVAEDLVRLANWWSVQGVWQPSKRNRPASQTALEKLW